MTDNTPISQVDTADDTAPATFPHAVWRRVLDHLGDHLFPRGGPVTTHQVTSAGYCAYLANVGFNDEKGFVCSTPHVPGSNFCEPHIALFEQEREEREEQRIKERAERQLQWEAAKAARIAAAKERRVQAAKEAADNLLRAAEEARLQEIANLGNAANWPELGSSAVSAPN